MMQSELFETIRELCESALYLYSIDKVGQAHRLLAKCEVLLAEHGYELAAAPPCNDNVQAADLALVN